MLAVYTTFLYFKGVAVLELRFSLFNQNLLDDFFVVGVYLAHDLDFAHFSLLSKGNPLIH
jgi:hypothetical protein